MYPGYKHNTAQNIENNCNDEDTESELSRCYKQLDQKCETVLKKIKVRKSKNKNAKTQ